MHCILGLYMPRTLLFSLYSHYSAHVTLKFTHSDTQTKWQLLLYKAHYIVSRKWFLTLQPVSVANIIIMNSECLAAKITEQFRGQTRNCHCPSLILVPFLLGGGGGQRGIHSSIYLFGDREQLERLASCQPRALDSVLNWPCPAHHHRTSAYRDTEMTCNTSPDSRRGGGGSHHLFFHSPATSFVSWLFNFPVPCFLSADDA